MVKLYTVKVLRACVVNRKPREVGEEVADVTETDKNGLLYGGKIEVVSEANAADIINARREEKLAVKAAPQKVAKKATKKVAKND